MVEVWRLALLAALALSACGGQDEANVRPLTIEERGRIAFAPCAVCHSVKDPSAPGYARLVGPSLFNIYGAPSARQEFDYSPAMRNANLVWDDAMLDAFIASPSSIVPKSRMSYAGEANAEKRAAIVAYLKTLKGENP